MSLRYPLKTLNLVPSSARTANGDSGLIVINDMEMKNLIVKLSVSAVSGTSPTLDVYFQQSLDGGNTFVDVAHFPQVTSVLTNPHWVCLPVGADNSVKSGVGDGTIAAGTTGVSLVSNVWRVKWVIGGTTPSFTFAVDAFYA